MIFIRSLATYPLAAVQFLMTRKTMLVAAIALAGLSNAYAGGNPERGAELIKQKNCASCHGANFINSVSPEYPKLAGQHADYLYHALLAYKTKNPIFGRENALMAGQAAQLSNQDMQDIAAYLSSLPTHLVMKK